MKKLLILALLFIGCAALNIKDSRGGEKRYIIKAETLYDNAIIVESREYYINGNLKEEAIFKNGQIFSVKEYYKNGNLENQLNVIDSTYIEYNKNGTKEEEGKIDNVTFAFLNLSALSNLGILTTLVEMPEGNGVNKEYYENGTLKEYVSYSNGKLNGSFKEYYEAGSLKSEGNYNNGVLDGIVKEYYEPKFRFIPFDKPPKPRVPVRPLYPDIAQRAGIEGTVYIQFYIDVKGNVLEAYVRKGMANTALDDAALTAVKKSKWYPAQQRDKKVGAWQTIPVVFSLTN